MGLMVEGDSRGGGGVDGAVIEVGSRGVGEGGRDIHDDSDDSRRIVGVMVVVIRMMISVIAVAMGIVMTVI